MKKSKMMAISMFCALSAAISVAADPIRLKSGEIDPLAAAARAFVSAMTTTANPAGENVYIVQCKGVITSAWRKGLIAKGARVLRYVPENAYLVAAAAAAASAIRDGSDFSYFGEYRPEHKLSGAADAVMAQAKSVTAAGSGAEGDAVAAEFVISLFDATFTDVVTERISALDGCSVSGSGSGSVIRARLTQAGLAAVASWSEVEWVEPFVAPELLNNVAVDAARMNVRSVWPSGASGLGLTGRGQVVAVADTGLDTGNASTVHRDVRGRISRTYGVGRTGQWDDPDGHGTHVVGSVLGSGAASSSSYRGVAYESTLIMQSILNSSGGLSVPSDLNVLFSQAYNDESGKKGARLHSNSWGSGSQSYSWLLGAYNYSSQDIDQFCFEHPDMLIFFAAGNSGIDYDEDGVIDEDSLCNQATAKNCMSVGAAENQRTSGGYSGYKWGQAWPYNFPESPISGDYISRPAVSGKQGMAAFSSRGPCDDGRIKPDIVAPGTDILSMRSSVGEGMWGYYNSYYQYSGGTSMATPLVAGTAAVVRQWLVERKGLANPDGATVKAVMLAGAKSLTPGQYGTGVAREIPASYPNNVEGWGQANLGNSVANDNGVEVFDGRVISTGESHTYKFKVSEPGSELAFVLAYADAPASLSASRQLVNDLDLLVTTPSGRKIYPNSRSSADRVNNVEGVRVSSAETGDYTVKVTGYSVNTPMSTSWTGGKEDATRYSLVVNGAVTAPTIELPDPPDIYIPTYGTSSSNESYIKVEWGSVAGASSYDIYRSETNVRPSSPFRTGVSSPYLDYASSSGLVPGKKYYYWVSAVNSAGTSYSSSDWGNIAVVLSLGRDSVEFTAAGGSVSVSVSANSSCEATVSETTWLTVYSSGTSGGGSFVLEAEENDSQSERDAVVRIVAGSDTDYPVTRTLAVSQGAAAPEFVIVDHVLVGYNGNGGVVTIPAEAHSIGASVFKNNGTVTGVIFHDGVTNVCDSAFYGCNALETVDFGEGLREIGGWAFQNSGLRSISLPDSLERIGTSAFFSCKSLVSADLGSGVKTLRYGVFYLCSALKEISIPDSVTDMEDGHTFYWCSSLESVTFGSGLKEIPRNCFFDCAALRSVTVPGTVESLAFRAFFGCTALSDLTLTDGVRKLGENVFDDCTALRSVVIPRSVTEIGNYAFIGCSGLTNVTYLGNAPAVQPGIYRHTPSALVSYVPVGSTGWNGTAGSTVLPAVFPADGGDDARAIYMPGPPAIPVLTVTTRDSTANESYIGISWTSADGALSYNLYRSESGVRPSTPVKTGVTSPYRDQANASGLNPGVRYYYWVEAINGSGSSFSSSDWGNISAVNPPNAPDVPVATGDENGVSVSWGAVDDADSYRIYRSASYGGAGTIIADALTALEYTDFTAVPGIDYWYRVAAVNEDGESVSDPVSAYRRIALSVPTDALTFPGSGSAVEVAVSANTEWSAESSASWLTLSVTGGEGDGPLAVTASENPALEPRDGMVEITAGRGTEHPVSVVIAVSQSAADRTPEAGNGVINGLEVKRYWPDTTSGRMLECSFDFALGDGVESMPVEFKVVDVASGLDITADCYFYDIGANEYGDSFENGSGMTAGFKKLRVDHYEYEGCKTVVLSVRVEDGEWVDTPPVRVQFGSRILASGKESFYDGTRHFTTNTLLMANGYYDFSLNPLQEDPASASGFVYVENSPDVVVADGLITTNTVWTADVIHLLRGDVTVPDGVTLTICNGAHVRLAGAVRIYVLAGGCLKLQGTSFENWAMDDADGDNIYPLSAADAVWFEDGAASALAGEISGSYNDYSGDETVGFSFQQSYTVGEKVGDLPVPDISVPGCTSDGWKYRDADYALQPVDPDTVMDVGAFGCEYLPLNVQVELSWVPAMPANVHAITSGGGIEEYNVGRQVIIRWDTAVSPTVTGHQIRLFGEGETLSDEDWQYVSGTEHICYDVPIEVGIQGGERVYCQIRAMTDSAFGETLEFSFVLPLVFELPATSASVGEFGGYDSVHVTANVDWTAESSADWIAVEYDGSSFSYTVGENPGEVRSGRIAVTGGGITKSFTVIQGAGEIEITKTADPVISPADGYVFESDTCLVSIECDTAGAQIYYTTDGSEPSALSGRLYASAFEIAETTVIKAIAVSGGLEDSEMKQATIIKAGELTLDDALDVTNVTAVCSGDANWCAVIDGTAVRGASARSGRISLGQRSTLSVSVSGPGTLSFRWKTDCVSDVSGNYGYDLGAFSVDGSTLSRIDGTTGWQTMTVPVEGSGSHVLEWSYIKNDRDEGMFVGEDCLWVDYVVWTPSGAGSGDVDVDIGDGKSISIPRSWFEQYPELLEKYGSAEAMAAAKSGKCDCSGNALYIWQDYVAGTDPSDPASVFKVTAFSIVDGKLSVSWAPDLNEGGRRSERTYSIFGAESPGQDGWTLIESDSPDAKYRFFKVTVEMK